MLGTDIFWMQKAIQEAKNAVLLGEVPVGSCLIDENDQLLALGHNLAITNSDPTAHAEIVAIRAAAAAIGNYRLTGTTIYTTIEPCAMCAGALVNGRVRRLVYGAVDERFGGIETHFGIGTGGELNHRLEVTGGVLAAECRALMQDFFRSRRSRSEPPDPLLSEEGRP
jgi:tRNA(adenine34) deaminase